MKACCLECPGWVPVTLLQFTCLSFLITFWYEALITNHLCRHASSFEASVYHFRAGCGLVIVEWAVPMHTSNKNTHHASCTVPLNTGKERNAYSSLSSDLLSWAGPLPLTSKLGDAFWHESLLLVLLGVFITLPGMAQTRCSGTHLLLPFSPHSSWVAGQTVFL